MAILSKKLKEQRKAILAGLDRALTADEDEETPVVQEELTDEDMENLDVAIPGEEAPATEVDDAEVPAEEPAPATEDEMVEEVVEEAPAEVTEDAEETPATEDDGAEYQGVEAALAQSKNITMHLLRSASNDDYSWVLSADVTPVALISFDKMKNKEAIRSYFVTASFRDKVFESFQRYGVKTTLNTLNAQILSNGQIVQPVVKQPKVDMQKIQDQIIHNFTEKMSLASSSYNRNLFNGHALKEAFFDVMSESRGKLSNAEIVEAALERGGDRYINDLIAKAEEWMHYKPSEFKAVVKILSEVNIPLSKLEADLEAEECEDEDCFAEDEESCEADGDALAASLAANSIIFNNKKAPAAKTSREEIRRKLFSYKTSNR